MFSEREVMGLVLTIANQALGLKELEARLIAAYQEIEQLKSTIEQEPDATLKEEGGKDAGTEADGGVAVGGS